MVGQCSSGCWPPPTPPPQGAKLASWEETTRQAQHPVRTSVLQRHTRARHTPHTAHTAHTSHLTYCTHRTPHTPHISHTPHTSHSTPHTPHTAHTSGPQTPCGLGISASGSRLRNPGSQLSTRPGVAPGWGPGKGAPEGAGGPPGRTSCCLPPGDSGMKRLAHWPAPCTSWTLPHLNFALGTDPLRGTWEPQARTSPPGHSELTVRS